MGKTKTVSFIITKKLYQDQPKIKEILPAILSEKTGVDVLEDHDVKNQTYSYTCEVGQNAEVDVQSILSRLKEQDIKAKEIPPKETESDEEYWFGMI